MASSVLLNEQQLAGGVPLDDKTSAPQTYQFCYPAIPHFGDPERECQAAKSEAVLFDVSDRAQIEMPGKDARQFLDNFYTNDINRLGTVGEQPVTVVMTIADSDPSGLQANLKTFHQHGLYGTSVVTLLTVQNTQKVESVEIFYPEFVVSQLDTVLDDIPPAAAKTGALGNVAVIDAIAERARHFLFPLVIDPVMISKHGASLIDDAAVEVLQRKFVSKVFLVTPNVQEAARLAGVEVIDVSAMEKAASVISRMGARNVLVKVGYIDGDAVDVLWTDGQGHRLRAERVDTTRTVPDVFSQPRSRRDWQRAKTWLPP